MSNRRRAGSTALEALAAGQAITPATQPGGIYQSVLNQIAAINPEMADRAIVQSDGSLQLDGFRLTPVGLLGGERASLQEWQSIGRMLFRLNDSLQILLGDWLTQGERVHGKTIEQMADELGRKRKTLYNWKYVMSSVDISLRREVLSYKHYMLVAALDYESQAKWLGRAAEGHWSANRMHEEMLTDAPVLPKPATQLRYSPEVMNSSKVFFARVERIKRAFDGRDNPDQQSMLEYIEDIELFIRNLRQNFGQ